MKRSITNWYAAAAIAAGVMVSPAAFGQTAGLELQQQRQAERERDREQREARQANQRERRDDRREDRREDRQGDKQERREMKREREQLNNMPEAARKVLRAETANAQDVDYYRVPDQRPPQFGAQFTAADGRKYDLRVDRQGNVVSRNEQTAAQASAQAPIQPSQTPATPTTPAPTTPAPTTPAPGSATASTEAPESGHAMYRRLQANEVPQNIRAIFDRDTQGARDVRYYRTKYGQQLAYEAKWRDANGKEMKHYVNDSGQTLVRGESRDDDDNAQTAGSSTPANTGNNNSGSSNAIQTGRAELNDLPRPVQQQLRQASQNGKDVKFYRTKYGSKQAYQASFTGQDGKDHSVIVDADGKVLSQK